MKNNNNLNINKEKRILVASLGQCVHRAGIHNFMTIAEQIGFNCTCLSPAISNSTIIKEIEKKEPDILGLSYRLTPSTVEHILKDFFARFDKIPKKKKPKTLLFAGIPEVVKVAKRFDRFNFYFEGGEHRKLIIDVIENNKRSKDLGSKEPMNLISRINWKKPFPLIRAHFGLSSMEKTVKGIKEIANADILDIISIAPDQNTQEHFFHKEDQDKELSGAGGVPIRSKADFLRLHKARLIGNQPLLRVYAGTRDFIKLAKLYNETIQNAWAAIPLFWFNQMDGRGPLTLKESIKQHMNAIKWHGDHNIPVEINDSHHWSLRNAPDAVAVADMYLSGIIAKNLNVKHFIAQFMFNTPPSISLEMDLAKMLAKTELLNSLADENFKIIKQTRAGLASFPLDLDQAKGQLAISSLVQLTLKPDIIHVVSYSEADHAASSKDVIKSCKIVHQVINKFYASNLSFLDQRVLDRKDELIKQAKWIIELIPKLAVSKEEKKNPWINSNLLHRVVKYGIFDAPHLKNNDYAKGEVKTDIVKGGCDSLDSVNGMPINEIERITTIINNNSELHSLIDDYNPQNQSARVIDL